MSTLSRFAKSIFYSECSQDTHIRNIVNRVVDRAEGELDNFRNAISVPEDLQASGRLHDVIRFAHFVVEQTPSPIMMCNRSGVITYANQAFCNLLRASKEDVISKNADSLILKDGLQEWADHWDKVMAGERATCHVSMRMSNRRGKATEIISNVVQLEGQDVIVSFVLDQTEVKKIQDVTHESSEDIESTVAESQCLVLMVDRNMKIRAASRPWLEMYNQGRSVSGKNVDAIECIAKHDTHMIKRAFSGETVMSQKDVVMTADNYPRYVKKTIIPWYSKKKVAGAIVIQEIVTDRMILEKNAHRRGLMFHTIFNSIQRPITLLDPNGKVIEINQYMMDYCNLNHDDAIGRELWEICCYCSSNDWLKSEKKAAIMRAAAGENVECDWAIQDPHTLEEIRLKCFLRPFLGSDPTKIEFIVHDIYTY